MMRIIISLLQQRVKSMNAQLQAKVVSGDRELYENWAIKRQKVVGRGNNPVYEVQDEHGNIQCIKEIKLEDHMSEFIFRKEVELLNKLKHQPHPHIVQCKGSYCLSYKQPLRNRYGYIQMQKGQMNLKWLLEHRKEKSEKFTEQEVLIFLTSMLGAFAHLQRIELAHRDVKPSNIIIFTLDPLFLKICDVGSGTAVGACDHTENRTVTGTPYYLSPELLQAYRDKKNLANYKAYKSDCFSLGLVSLQFMTLQRIEQRQSNEVQRIQTAILRVKKQYPNIVGLGKVLRRMLDVHVKSRMDFVELEAYINENQLLRKKVNWNIELDPLLVKQITSSQQLHIQKFQDLANLPKIINTGNHVPIVRIQLSSSNGFVKKHEKETLEQIRNIRHMEIQQLYLKAPMCQLEDREAEFVAAALIKNSRLRILDIDFWNNEIKNEGFAKMLAAVQDIISSVEELAITVSNNCLRVCKTYAQLFDMSRASKLRKLHLNLSFNEISSDYLANFVRDVSGAPDLQEMVLNVQKMGLTHIYMNRAMKQFQRTNSLKVLSLNISSNQIRDEGMFGIGNALEAFDQLKELSIVARSAEIGDKGFSEFSKSLASLQALTKLKLNFISNSISEKGLSSGLPGIGSLKALVDLDMNISNNRVNFLGAKWLWSSLLPLKELRRMRLILDSTDISEKGCLYLGRLVSELCSLNELELGLRDNDIKIKGVQFICQGLLLGKRIKKLKMNLAGTRIGDYASNYLAGCLLKIRCLSSVDLNMENCDLGSTTMENITRLVRECSRRADQITINMRRNQEIRMELYQQIKKEISNHRVAIKVDQPHSLNSSS